MLNGIIEFGQVFYPPCQDALGALECAQSFQGVMVGTQNYCGPNKVMTEVLEACDHRKELPPSRTVITLGRVHDWKKRRWTLYSVHRSGVYSAHRDIRRIGVQNKSLVWLWVSQGHRFGEGSFEAVEGLLGLE